MNWSGDCICCNAPRIGYIHYAVKKRKPMETQCMLYKIKFVSSWWSYRFSSHHRLFDRPPGVRTLHPADILEWVRPGPGAQWLVKRTPTTKELVVFEQGSVFESCAKLQPKLKPCLPFSPTGVRVHRVLCGCWKPDSPNEGCDVSCSKTGHFGLRF